MGWEVCGGVVGRVGGWLAPMSMLEDRERASSSGGGGLVVEWGEWECWREETGLIGFFPSDTDVEVPASWACASWDCGMGWRGGW